jgi:hypothetical protein
MKNKPISTIIIFLAAICISMCSSSGFAAGSNLAINDQSCSEGAGGEVSFTVLVNNAPGNIASMGFKISYDENILTYKQYTKGNLTQGFTMFGVSKRPGGILQVGGIDSDAGIIEGYSGDVLQLTFTLKSCEATSLKLIDLVDDVAGWSTTEGRLNPSSPAIPPAEPVNPSPADRAANVSQPVTLQWSSVSNADSYEVFLSTCTCFLASTSKGMTDSNSFNPGTLSPNTTYYWKVVASGDGGYTSSKIWSFTTTPPTPPITPITATAATAASALNQNSGYSWITPSYSWVESNNRPFYGNYNGNYSGYGLYGGFNTQYTGTDSGFNTSYTDTDRWYGYENHPYLSSTYNSLFNSLFNNSLFGNDYGGYFGLGFGNTSSSGNYGGYGTYNEYISTYSGYNKLYTGGWYGYGSNFSGGSAYNFPSSYSTDSLFGGSAYNFPSSYSTDSLFSGGWR